MNEPWYSLRTPDKDIPVNGYFEAVVQSGSLWFSGHFPGEPIVPGIAQISIINDIIKSFLHKGDETAVSELKRIRFRQVIRPDEVMKINILSDEKKAGTYNFKIMVGDDLTSNGILITRLVERNML